MTDRNNIISKRFYKGIFVFVYFLLLSLLLRIPAVPSLTSAYLGGSQADAGLYVWLFDEAIKSLNPSSWFNSSAFYPYRGSLSWSDNFIFPSLLGFILQNYLSFSKILSYNTILIVAGALNGLCLYKVGRRLGLSVLPALCSGSLFASLSYFSGNLGHPQLQFAFFLPLIFLFQLKFYEKPNLINSLFISLFFFLSFLTTVYFAVFGVLFFVLFSLSRARAPGYLTIHFKLLLTSFVPLLLFSPFILPYFDTQISFGSRSLYEPYFFSATLASFVSTTPFSFYYGDLSSLSHAEARFFFGVAASLLFIGALFKYLTSTKLGKIYLSLFLLGSIFTLSFPIDYLPRVLKTYGAGMFLWGAVLTFVVWILKDKRKNLDVVVFLSLLFLIFSYGPLGNTAKGEFPLGPYSLIHEFFPGFSGIRAISRIGVLYLMCASLTIGYLLNKMRRVWAILLIPLFIIENYCKTIPLETLSPPPAILSQIKNSSTVLFMPFGGKLNNNRQVQSWGEYARLNVKYMLWTQASNLKTVNGYSGVRTKLMELIPKKTDTFPDEHSLSFLKKIVGLKYVVVIPSFYENFDKNKFDIEILKYKKEVKIINYDSEGNYLLELTDIGKINCEQGALIPSYGISKISFSTENPSTFEILDEKNKVCASNDLKLKDVVINLDHCSNRTKPFKLQCKEVASGIVTYSDLKTE